MGLDFGTVKVIRVEEALSPSVGGLALVRSYRVHFKVAEHGPFTLDFPEADFTPERFRAAAGKLAATIGGLPT